MLKFSKRKFFAFTLAEGATHVGTWKVSRQVAFTLAEVLITLGVIGVVAAMTLPTLIQNYNKKAWTTQLQKSYSMWEQAFQKMMADDGVQKLTDTSVWAPIGSKSCSADNIADKEYCAKFFDNLKNYIKIIGIENYGNNINYVSGDRFENFAGAKFLVLYDGSMVFAYADTKNGKGACDVKKSLGGKMCTSTMILYIDVNGQRGPNTWGRDVFAFQVSDEGKLYPFGGKDVALYNSAKALEENESYWRNEAGSRYCGTPGEGISKGSNIYGSGCAARIMENGWKMDY